MPMPVPFQDRLYPVLKDIVDHFGTMAGNWAGHARRLSCNGAS